MHSDVERNDLDRKYAEFLRWIDETDFYEIIDGHNVSTKNLVHALCCAYDAIKKLEKRVATLEALQKEQP